MPTALEDSPGRAAASRSSLRGKASGGRRGSTTRTAISRSPAARRAPSSRSTASLRKRPTVRLARCGWCSARSRPIHSSGAGKRRRTGERPGGRRCSSTTRVTGRAEDEEVLVGEERLLALELQAGGSGVVERSRLGNLVLRRRPDRELVLVEIDE